VLAWLVEHILVVASSQVLSVGVWRLKTKPLLCTIGLARLVIQCCVWAGKPEEAWTLNLVGDRRVGAILYFQLQTCKS